MLNGAIYLIKTQTLLKREKLITPETTAFVMKKENSIDIDDQFDFKISEFLIKEREENVP